jgi:hypothetical protein
MTDLTEAAIHARLTCALAAADAAFEIALAAARDIKSTAAAAEQAANRAGDRVGADAALAEYVVGVDAEWEAIYARRAAWKAAFDARLEALAVLGYRQPRPGERYAPGQRVVATDFSTWAGTITTTDPVITVQGRRVAPEGWIGVAVDDGRSWAGIPAHFFLVTDQAEALVGG